MIGRQKKMKIVNKNIKLKIGESGWSILKCKIDWLEMQNWLAQNSENIKCFQLIDKIWSPCISN